MGAFEAGAMSSRRRKLLGTTLGSQPALRASFWPICGASWAPGHTVYTSVDGRRSHPVYRAESLSWYLILRSTNSAADLTTRWLLVKMRCGKWRTDLEEGQISPPIWQRHTTVTTSAGEPKILTIRLAEVGRPLHLRACLDSRL